MSTRTIGELHHDRQGTLLNWTESKLKRARKVVEDLGSCVAAAPVLAQEFDEIITDAAVRRALNRKRRLMLSEIVDQLLPNERANDMRLIFLAGDAHVPEHDRRLWAAIDRWLREYQPDEIILAGDIGEYTSVSRHGGNWGSMLDAECDQVRHFIEDRQKCCPEASITYMEGNHETRFMRFIEEVVPSLAGTYSIPKGCKLDELKVTWVPEAAQPIRRGKLKVLHGHQESRHGGELPKHHAMRMGEIYGEVDHDVVYFHTHKSQSYAHPRHGGIARATGIGCTRSLKPRWMHGKEAGWTHQFAVAFIGPHDYTALFPVSVVNSTFCWDGKIYSADS